MIFEPELNWMTTNIVVEQEVRQASFRVIPEKSKAVFYFMQLHQ